MSDLTINLKRPISLTVNEYFLNFGLEIFMTGRFGVITYDIIFIGSSGEICSEFPGETGAGEAAAEIFPRFASI